MRQAGQRYRLGKAKRTGMKILDELKQARMREHFHLWPRAWLAVEFEAASGKRLTVNQLDNIGTRMNLRGAPNEGRISKGAVPWNKGMKGLRTPGSERTWFRKGHASARTKPMFSERWSVRPNRGGQRILEVKVPEASSCPVHKRTGWNQKSRWIRKAVWVWRHAHGDVPKGHAIIQLDGDPANCALSNLDCVPLRVLSRLKHYHAPRYAGPEANPARVRLAQLQVALDGRARS